MRSHKLQQWLTVGAILLALPVLALAQEATLSGTASDTTGGALPGVTVRAVHEASGNNFEAVTDARGEYRLPVRVGAYRLTADLAGFAPVTRTLTLLVGQQAVVNLQMSVSGVQESVTVTGEAPLLDVTGSTMGGNIDPRQLQELPIQGRDYLDLVILAPGARANAVGTDTPTEQGRSDNPSPSTRFGGDFQLNIDGLQVTQNTSAGEGQPSFSRDAIAEFEFVSSRFDATQGRSSGVQVNVVTKSGTNTPSGNFGGYFRHDRFNAADHVTKRVLPYQDQQLSGTFGGPIRRDKLHVFANYEYEHEPLTIVYTTPYPYFNRSASGGVHTEKKAGVRLDGQFSPRTRLVVRGSGWWLSEPKGAGSGTSTPASFTFINIRSIQLMATLTQVLSSRAVNEVKVGYSTHQPDSILPPKGDSFFRSSNGPHALLQGITVGGASIFPQTQGQYVSSVRDDFTSSFTKGGRHTVKLGAEYLDWHTTDFRCQRCDGELTADLGPIPVPVETLFPDLFDPSTWNWGPLSPISVRWRHQAGSARSVIPRQQIGVWVQDDWTLVPRLTLNLGLRYDLERDAFNNSLELGRFLPANRPNDTNNLGPRVGFSFSQNERTVIRGGYGVYFASIVTSRQAPLYVNTRQFATANDGRPDFASNPFNGPKPTFEEVAARDCTLELLPRCIRREAATGGVLYGPDFVMPYAHQASIGLQRQLGSGMAIEADYTYAGNRGRPDDLPLHVTYNPATGANYPFSDISRRPFPDWGYISLTVNGSRSNSHALQTALTKRFSGGWQATGTYLLSVTRDARPKPLQWNGSRFAPVPFETAPDLGGEYGLSIGDQRHRATFNGLWELGYGFQLSGLYIFGSGERRHTNWGRDLRQIGATRPNELRLRPDGTIVPRNNFVGDPIHRVDLRLQRRFPLGGRATIDGLLEVFNVLNHANYESYITREDNRNYGQPQQAENVTAYGPRTLQLGFRFAF